MNKNADLPEQRPMPEGLRDRLWTELEPQLQTRASEGRFQAMRAPLAVAASVVVLAVGVAIALPQFRGQGPANAVIATADSPDDVRLLPGEAQLVDECVRAGQDVPDPASWRPGARIDVDAEHGFLVIRNTEYAAVCIINNGKGTGILGGVNTNHVYSKLTAARPFDYLSSWNDETGSIHFGIATSDVTGVSLVGPDQSVTPTVLRNGTFLAKSKFPEGSGQSTTNHIRATLTDGQHLEGPFR